MAVHSIASPIPSQVGRYCCRWASRIPASKARIASLKLQVGSSIFSAGKFKRSIFSKVAHSPVMRFICPLRVIELTDSFETALSALAATVLIRFNTNFAFSFSERTWDRRCEEAIQIAIPIAPTDPTACTHDATPGWFSTQLRTHSQPISAPAVPHIQRLI